MNLRTIWVIDTETTGASPKEGAAICEVAAVPVLENGKVIMSKFFSQLINPGHPIPPDMSAIHHIIDADVKTKPMIHEAKCLKKIGSDIIAAHNMEFDWAFLEPALSVLPAHRLCTYRLALHMFPDAPNHKNQTLRYYLGEEPPASLLKSAGHAHRALYDTFVTAFVFARMLKEHSLDELIEMSSKPVLLKTCHYRAHKGKPWSQVPKDYLSWILRGGDHSPDVTYTARHWINTPTPRPS